MDNGSIGNEFSDLTFGIRPVFTDEERFELSKNVNCVILILIHI